MKLDLLLFGRIESGPFFALLENGCATSSGPSGRLDAYGSRSR